MKTLIGGAISAVLGIVGLAVWWSSFLNIIAGVLPIILLLGGALALYLGFDELKESWKQDEGVDEDYSKQRIDELEKEVEELKNK